MVERTCKVVRSEMLDYEVIENIALSKDKWRSRTDKVNLGRSVDHDKMKPCKICIWEKN